MTGFYNTQANMNRAECSSTLLWNTRKVAYLNILELWDRSPDNSNRSRLECYRTWRWLDSVEKLASDQNIRTRVAEMNVKTF